jgi:hypothetical protein
MTYDEHCEAITGFMKPAMAKANQPTNSWSVVPTPDGLISVTVGAPHDQRSLCLNLVECELDSGKEKITTFLKENLKESP